MRIGARPVLACVAVALIFGVVAGGVALGPESARRWLLLAGLVAGVAAFQAVAADPRDLAPALLFSLFPVLALLAEGSPFWLIGPLAALLLVAAELAALSWECQGDLPLKPAERRRIADALRLGALGFGSGLAIGLIRPFSLSGGAALMLVAAAAFIGMGYVVFRSSGANPARRS